MARTRRVAAPQTAETPAPACEVVGTPPRRQQAATLTKKIALTCKEVAALYSLSPKVIWTMIHRGQLPAIRPPGTKAFVIRVQDLEAVLSPQLFGTPSAPPRRQETDDEKAERQLRAAGIA